MELGVSCSVAGRATLQLGLLRSHKARQDTLTHFIDNVFRKQFEFPSLFTVTPRDCYHT